MVEQLQTNKDEVSMRNLGVLAEFLAVIRDVADQSDRPDEVIKTAQETLREVFGSVSKPSTEVPPVQQP